MNTNGIKFMVSRSSLILAKHSPEILMGVGIAGVIGSTILSCRATLKAQKVMEEIKIEKEKIDRAWAMTARDAYTDNDRKKDLAGVYGAATGKLIRLYGPPVLLGAASIGCLIGSHHILTKRNAGLAAAYKLLDEGFKKYRKNVVNKYGEDEDRRMRYGIEPDKAEPTAAVATSNPKGEEVVEEKGPPKLAPDQPSIYAKWFDEDNIFWKHDIEYNIFFLRTRQTLANKTLQAKGHLFLNDLWDMLGIPRTPEGAIVGWLWNRKGDEVGDAYVDFGLDDVFNIIARDFINGYRPGFLIDPNVQGNIWDLI